MIRMNRKRNLVLVAACILLLMTTGCMSSMSSGNSGAKTTATGAAGGSTAQNANRGLERCTGSLGTLAIYEDRSEDWYRYLTTDLRLPSTVPVLRLLAQQSNCFVVVERGKAMRQMMEERALMQSGEMRRGSNFGKGQMVAADYTMTPSITFSAHDTSGGGALVGALFGSAAGAVAGGFKTSDASTMLTLIENRSGVQLAAAEGSARNTDFALLGGMFGHHAGGAAGAYGRTPEGKVIVAAFTDSMNNLIRAVKSYRAQSVAGGLGTGGNMAVQGGAAAMASSNVYEGVMTQRNYNAVSRVYDYVIVTKDRSRTFTFSSGRKIPFKNDLVQFYAPGGQVDQSSFKLLERQYMQKYWR